MRAGIDAVLSGKSDEFEAEGIYPDMVEEYLSALGWKKQNFDTNGWQYDWWLYFNKPGEEKRYMASGSGYYGGFSFLEDKEDA